MTEIPADTEGAHESFIGILLFDVIDAIERHGGAGSQSSKRDLIRTGFAAIEGVAWIFREHIVDAARTTSNLDPAEEVERVMAAANVAIKEYLVKFSEILTQLKKGDPAILAEYQAAADALQENGRRSIQP